MGFIIEEHDRQSRGFYTTLIDTTSRSILGNVFASAKEGYREENETLSEYRGIMSGASIGIYGKEIDSKKGVGSLILEHTLDKVKSRFKDQQHHMDHVERYSVAIGKALGVQGDELKELALAAKLHDVGKAFIDPDILNKPGKLAKEEMETIKKHPEIGYWLLKGDKRYRKLAKYIRHHHERWDGLGYPGGLKSEEIPLFSRIISVADAYDAMTTKRVYQKTKSREEAFRELIEHSGTQFDTKIVKVFVEKVLLKFPNIYNEKTHY